MKKKPGCLLLIACWSTLCFAQQVVVTDATLSGNGTTATPLKIAQHSAATDQVLKWSGTSWLPKVDGLSLPFKGETSTGTYGISIGHTAKSGVTYSGQFISHSTSGRGIHGNAIANSGRTYGGYFESRSNEGIGVLGKVDNTTGTTYGIYGTVNSNNGKGVYGYAIAPSGITYGGYFQNSSINGIGVYGKGISLRDSSCGTGVYGEAGQYGVFGRATATSGFSYGGYFMSANTGGRGLMGTATATTGRTYGGYFNSSSSSGTGVYSYASASSGTNIGGWFATNSPSGYGVYANGPAFAGAFRGSVIISANLFVEGEIIGCKNIRSLEIDHPLDPANKLLRHSSVESPDMMNIYNGNIITDGSGSAIVILPDYFEKLNKDFRYQLTVIGDFAQAIIGEKIKNNRFTIRTDKPNMEVSWQVTGVRQDPWAKDNHVVVEEQKKPEKQGYYLYPQGYGQPEDRSIWHEETKLMQEVAREPESFPKEPLQLPKEVPELEFDK